MLNLDPLTAVLTDAFGPPTLSTRRRWAAGDGRRAGLGPRLILEQFQGPQDPVLWVSDVARAVGLEHLFLREQADVRRAIELVEGLRGRAGM